MTDQVSVEVGEVAARVVADLMPIAMTVCGPGEAAFAEALRAAGADAGIFGTDGGAFDLGVLLAATPAPSPAQHGATVAALAAAADRLLFVPVPLGHAATMDIDAWFELFADQGFQPVVDYDAGFLGAGAFLVDRNATAAESELSDFAERVSLGGSLAVTTQRLAALEAELQQVSGEAGDRGALRSALAGREAELATARAEAERWRTRAIRAEADAEAVRREFGAWEALGRWVWAVCALPERNAVTLLRAAGGGQHRRSFLLGRLRRKPAAPNRAEQRLLEDATLARRSRQFDAAWYIASHPELAAAGDDPVWHYILRGAAAGAEPGPYFDSAPWRARYPNCNPLAEAVRQGKDETGIDGPGVD